jgi:release factor glutamine methyltransferase
VCSNDCVRLKETLASAVLGLAEAKVPSPRMNAELLLMFTLGCERSHFFAHPERQITHSEAARYEAALSERKRGVPTQYITGHQEFWGLDLIVTPAVLIPRPETEHLVETVLDLTSASRRDQNAPHAIRIIDVGTGSGCVSLALATEIPAAEIHATDISSAALEIARINAARHQLESRIHFHETDLLSGLESDSFDIVVSNPPYVGESEEDSVQLEVRKFEPRNAVFAGHAGTEVIARLIPAAHSALRPGGWLAMEISGTIAEAVKKMLAGWIDLRIVNDLQGIQRVVAARKPPR